MSDAFPLLKKLEQITKDPASNEPRTPRGLKYAERVLMVEDNETRIFIPLREAEAFDRAVSERGKYIDRHELSKLLRTHRGIRNWE